MVDSGVVNWEEELLDVMLAAVDPTRDCGHDLDSDTGFCRDCQRLRLRAIVLVLKERIRW